MVRGNLLNGVEASEARIGPPSLLWMAIGAANGALIVMIVAAGAALLGISAAAQ